MARKALIRDSDNLVVNVIILEEGTSWTPPEGHTIRDAADAGPGDTWDGTQYIRPKPKPVKHWWSA